MSTVYSESLFLIHDGGTAERAAPAGTRWVIRCVTYFNAAIIGSNGGQISFGGDATIWDRSIAPGVAGQDDMHVVVPDGVALQVTCDPEVDITVSGYQLTLP